MLKQSIKNTRMAQMLAAMSIALVMFVGCSSDNNPAGPGEDPAPVVKKPVSMVVTSIEVSKFKNKDWDPTELITAWRKADLFVTMKRNGAASNDYTSDVRENVSATARQTFTKTGVLLGKDLPLTYLFVDKLTVQVWDKEVFTNELMATINFDVTGLYKNDEALTFAHTMTGANEVKIVVRGQWKY